MTGKFRIVKRFSTVNRGEYVYRYVLEYGDKEYFKTPGGAHPYEVWKEIESFTAYEDAKMCLEVFQKGGVPEEVLFEC